MSRAIIKMIAFYLMTSLSLGGLMAVGETSAFFSDAGNSTNNSFSATSLGFSLSSGSDFSPDLDNSQTTSTRNVQLKKNGALDFQYQVKVKETSGDLCQYLELKDNLSGTFESLENFSSSITTFSTKNSWQFTSRVPETLTSSFQGKACSFKLAFEGWQTNIPHYGEGGFTDYEELVSTIQVRYWDPPVVLNEFLPNAGDYPEFVELYNKTDEDINLSRFYIMAGNNRIDVNSTNTQTYSFGLGTTIPGDDWLVVTAPEDNLLDDTSGTVTLYNQNDVVVDSYDYDGSDYNINNTPGWTNDLVAYWPFDEGSGDTAYDKSDNNNNGKIYGVTSTTGKINQAFSFDGLNDSIKIEDSDSLDTTSQITVETWIKPATKIDSFNSGMRIVDKQHSYYLLFDYPVADGKLKLVLRIGGNFVEIASAKDSWEANQWYHLVGTYDGSTMTLYVNGNVNKSVARTGNIEATNYNLFLGTRAVSNIPSDMFFDGIIDEVKIYNRALSADEISKHYNDVSTPPGSVPVDKSYARIPDGSNNWVDPFPTPGGPNRNDLENSQSLAGNQNNEEEVNLADTLSNDPIEEVILPEEETEEEPEKGVSEEGKPEEDLEENQEETSEEDLEETPEEISEENTEETSEETTEENSEEETPSDGQENSAETSQEGSEDGADSSPETNDENSTPTGEGEEATISDEDSLLEDTTNQSGSEEGATDNSSSTTSENSEEGQAEESTGEETNNEESSTEENATNQSENEETGTNDSSASASEESSGKESGNNTSQGDASGESNDTGESSEGSSENNSQSNSNQEASDGSNE